ncbi:peptide-methionine (R)-S-oxide reductase MsrB (plasmid) [Aquincola tertiaricarbonis]|jgi:peptide-methionine (R)-S-oxide reductase|uniref:peptide-methionine (R)-S-oxide reductase n=1 Tax=Aquincola tertiaricarbonis TaxID=391953 RepID=A0ABY4SIT9_AQUTE|nr:peptide-methionine (R)-S-oxide reductase MsrB [Aquincola tertiaricarbonis]URI12075.1 peptide-methionine (R)-S-oxide reductase MsrB [Aquincola tertiaricarbonis]
MRLQAPMQAFHTWADVISRANSRNPDPPRRLELTEDQWRARLHPEVFNITRRGHTEPAHSSAMCSRFEPGQYACACCGTTLFEAEHKFRSGSGWPSFTRPASDAVVAYRIDDRHGARRIESACNVCDAHLGHVFPDGPPPSGLRMCINALALTHDGGAPTTLSPA